MPYGYTRTKPANDAMAKATATLYAKIEASSPSPRDRDDARAAREALLSKIGRVQVTGEFDTASVDGEPVDPAGPSYVEPGEHVVTG